MLVRAAMKAGPAKSCPSCGERYDTDVLFCPRDGTPLANARGPVSSASDRDPYLGTELPGQIRLDHLIGIGSMGRVYRAFQGGIERDVAVKVLHRELSGNAELVTRFHREAKVASRLVHPNVVQVLMTGALPQGSDPRTGGELYLVMEYLDGISLLSALAAAGTSGESSALPVTRALHITLQVCDAVGEAHAQGIVHRDIKPENVMLVRRGDDPDYAKVLDFGIARLDWAERGMTQAGLIFGTAKYISPEGAEGHPVGPAADVYSIATMLYQMLAGRTPFEGDSPVALLVQHTHAPPLEIRTIARASYVPAPLAAAIMRNLSKKPGERAQNARAFAKDLVAAARASGLCPEDIATQSTLFSPTSLGSVKLASKERTRSHELSAELAAKIGGVAANPDASLKRTNGAGQAHARPADATNQTPTLPSPKGEDANGSSADALPDTARRLHEVGPSAKPPSALPETMPGRPYPEIAADVAEDPPPIEAEASNGPASTMPGSPAPAHPSGPPTTMQGTETTLDEVDSLPRPRRARMARVAAIATCALIVAGILILGGRRLTSVGATAASSDSVEAALDEARDCMRRRAWDAPPGHNFKEVTDAAIARWKDSAALLDLRREAAERLVTDALGRKYAGDIAEASHLAELALYFDPHLTTAQHLEAELAALRSPDVAPVSTTSASASDRPGKPPHRRPTAGPAPSAPRAPASARDPAHPPLPGSAVLPPPPAPHPPGETPAPASTGPWL